MNYSIQYLANSPFPQIFILLSSGTQSMKRFFKTELTILTILANFSQNLFFLIKMILKPWLA